MPTARTRIVALLALTNLACAGLDAGPPERVDGLSGILVVTTELDSELRDELGVELEALVELGGYAIAVEYSEGELRLLTDCSIPQVYEWVQPLGLAETRDSDQALFVGARPGRSDAFVRLDHDASVHYRTQRRATLPDDEPLRDHVDSSACASATHVVREFMYGVVEPEGPEQLVALRIEPLPTKAQQRWIARKDRRVAAGEVALSALGTLMLASLAVLCLSDLDSCSDDDSDDYASEFETTSTSERARSGRALPAHRPSSVSPSTNPGPGTPLGRSRRVQVEAGAGGFTLRF